MHRSSKRTGKYIRSAAYVLYVYSIAVAKRFLFSYNCRLVGWHGAPCYLLIMGCIILRSYLLNGMLQK
jgi:hypothetical protein